MDKLIDHNDIQITGKSQIKDELELGKDVVVLLKGQVVMENYSDNQDGSVNRTYKIKPYLVEIIKDNIVKSI